MSEIIVELEAEIAKNRAQLGSLAKTESARELYTLLLNIASKVGAKYNIRIELSFPEKNSILDIESYGKKNVSFFVEKGRKQFRGVTADEVKRRVQLFFPNASIEPARFGYEGWHVQTHEGRIDVLAGALHIWRPITNEVIQLVDWLFAKTYQR